MELELGEAFLDEDVPLEEVSGDPSDSTLVE